MSSPSMFNEHQQTHFQDNSRDSDFRINLRAAQRDVDAGVQQAEREIDREISALRRELRSAGTPDTNNALTELGRVANAALEQNQTKAQEVVEIFKDLHFRKANKQEPFETMHRTTETMSDLERKIVAALHDFSEHAAKSPDRGQNASLSSLIERVRQIAEQATGQLERNLDHAQYLQSAVQSPHGELNRPSLQHFQRPQEKAIDQDVPLNWVPGMEAGWKLAQIADGETITGMPVDRKESTKELLAEEAKEIVIDLALEKGLAGVMTATEIASEKTAEGIAEVAPDLIRMGKEALTDVHDPSRKAEEDKK